MARSLALALALACLGCGGSRTAAPVMETEVVHQAAPMAVTASVDTLPPGVSARATACEGASSDPCNAQDDDCDGRIDEGCGWESGPVQITLAWDTGADLDLYVTEPSGFTISYLDRASPRGGQLDHDARGACVPSGVGIENVHWTDGAPPAGTYRVDVHYWGDCGVAGSTPAHVSVSVGGRIVGVYELVLELGQRRATVSFRI